MPAVLTVLGTGHACSGPELARRLGISPAAVWKQVAVLRATGLEILTSPDGYRLPHPLDRPEPSAVLAGVPGGLRRRLGIVENHWRIDSTSSECQRRAAVLPDLSFVFADWQEAGRGRRGRRWIAPPAASLQVSCLKRFAGGYATQSGLSLVAGIAAAQAVEDCGGVGVALKWPNDLVRRDAKLGGILVELGGEAMGSCQAIIGIGINVDVPDAARRALGRACVDLATLRGGKPPSRVALATRLIVRLIAALDLFADAGFAGFADAWHQRDSLCGRLVRVTGAHGAFAGVAAGVDARGALRVRTTAGIRRVDSAEVSVRPA